MKLFKRFGLAVAALFMIAGLTLTQPALALQPSAVVATQFAEVTSEIDHVTFEKVAATSNYFQNHVLDGTFRGQTALTPTNSFIGLYTATATAQSCTSEVSTSSSGYGRVSYANTLANWSGTQGAGTTTASSNASGSSGTISNNNAITFGSPTASWGTITYSCIQDSSTGGNELIYFPLTTPKTVNSGDAAPSYAAGALTITLGWNLPDHWKQVAANDDLYAAAA